MEVRTSALVSTIETSDGAAFARGRSMRRRNPTLLTFVNATSMTDITKRARMNTVPMRNSVPFNIRTCAASDVQGFSFPHGQFRGRIPSDAAVRAERVDEYSFRNGAFEI